MLKMTFMFTTLECLYALSPQYCDFTCIVIISDYHYYYTIEGSRNLIISYLNHIMSDY